MRVQYQLESDQSVLEVREEAEWPRHSKPIRLTSGTFKLVDTDVSNEEGVDLIATVRPGKPGKVTSVVV